MLQILPLPPTLRMHGSSCIHSGKKKCPQHKQGCNSNLCRVLHIKEVHWGVVADRLPTLTVGLVWATDIKVNIVSQRRLRPLLIGQDNDFIAEHAQYHLYKLLSE